VQKDWVAQEFASVDSADRRPRTERTVRANSKAGATAKKGWGFFSEVWSRATVKSNKQTTEAWHEDLRWSSKSSMPDGGNNQKIIIPERILHHTFSSILPSPRPSIPNLLPTETDTASMAYTAHAKPPTASSPDDGNQTQHCNEAKHRRRRRRESAADVDGERTVVEQNAEMEPAAVEEPEEPVETAERNTDEPEAEVTGDTTTRRRRRRRAEERDAEDKAVAEQDEEPPVAETEKRRRRGADRAVSEQASELEYRQSFSEQDSEHAAVEEPELPADRDVGAERPRGTRWRRRRRREDEAAEEPMQTHTGRLTPQNLLAQAVERLLQARFQESMKDKFESKQAKFVNLLENGAESMVKSIDTKVLHYSDRHRIKQVVQDWAELIAQAGNVDPYVECYTSLGEPVGVEIFTSIQESQFPLTVSLLVMTKVIWQRPVQGDQVEVNETFNSDDNLSVVLNAGLIGTVTEVDRDGDFRVQFEGHSECWVFEDQSGKLTVHRSENEPSESELSELSIHIEELKDEPSNSSRSTGRDLLRHIDQASERSSRKSDAGELR